MFLLFNMKVQREEINKYTQTETHEKGSTDIYKETCDGYSLVTDLPHIEQHSRHENLNRVSVEN